MQGTDGYDHIGMIDASGGVLDQDYEMFELQTPHQLIQHEYICDSGGAGRWRGGLGVETKFKIGSDATQLVTFGDGDFEPAFGLFGGHDSMLNSIELNYPDGTRVVPRNKDLILGVPKGTLYHQIAGGGGGYGDPKQRDREKVARRSAQRRDLAAGGARHLRLRRRRLGQMNFELSDEQRPDPRHLCALLRRADRAAGGRDRRGARVSARTVRRSRGAWLLRHALSRRRAAASASI